MSQDIDDDEVLICFSDLIKVLKYSLKPLLISALLCGGFLFVYSLKKPCFYTASAKYKEQASLSRGIGSEVKSLLANIGNSGEESAAVNTMQSLAVLKPVVKELNLQATLTELGMGSRIKKFFDNLKMEFAFWKSKFEKRDAQIYTPGSLIPNKLLVKTYPKNAICHSVVYDSSICTTLSIHFTSDTTYTCKSSSVKYEGQTNKALTTDDWSFVIQPTGNSSLKGKNFKLVLLPVSAVVDSLAKSVLIKRDKEMKQILKLEFTHTDPQLASNVVNSVMRNYKKFTKNRQQKTTQKQVCYLESRQNEAMSKLVGMQNQTIKSIKDMLEQGGLIDVNEEVKFLAQSQLSLTKRQMEIDLQMKQLEQSQIQRLPLINQVNNNSLFDVVIKEIFKLKQERDSLNLSLNGQFEEPSLTTSEDSLRSLQEIHSAHAQTVTLLDSIESGVVDMNENKWQQAPSLVRSWVEKLTETQNNDSNVLPDQSSTILIYQKFLVSYLESLKSSYEFQEKITEERFKWNSAPNSEYSGLSLETAQKILKNNNAQIEDVSIKQKRIASLLNNIENPDFNLSSLNAYIKEDAAYEGLFKRILELQLQLTEQKNYSPKEHDRSKETLLMLREFFKQHLTQQKTALKDQELLLREKHINICKTLLDLINQRLYICENRFFSEIGNIHQSLESERFLIGNQFKDLNHRMLNVPERWFEQKRIDMQVKMNSKVIEELAKIVGAKNISTIFERSGSFVLEPALYPSIPNPPYLVFKTLAGILLGAMLCAVALMGKAVLKGFKATPENLKAQGLTIAGVLKKGVSTLPIIRSISQSIIKDRLVFFFQFNTLNIIQQLASLASKRGHKVLIIDCTHTVTENQSSLLQYLSQSSDERPKVSKGMYYDEITSCTSDGYLPELLQSRRFNEWSNSLSEYHSIYVVTSLNPIRPESAALSTIADRVIVNIINEKSNDFNIYKNAKNKLSAIFCYT